MVSMPTIVKKMENRGPRNEAMNFLWQKYVAKDQDRAFYAYCLIATMVIEKQPQQLKHLLTNIYKESPFLTLLAMRSLDNAAKYWKTNEFKAISQKVFSEKNMAQKMLKSSLLFHYLRTNSAKIREAKFNTTLDIEGNVIGLSEWLIYEPHIFKQALKK